ncbi:ATP-binding cassette sub-family A member 12 isoform X2 [Denticeps clupeoides]|uniref:ATP-binding cassette sub-family A member 12 isoform X2 n=1 Tax=Denticeps clupeoides TaxID=299321 RepID=UPI0010A4671E|nr:ATP-binding cassette sub-family A member 12 isoform X2 [Denticeps clupeoides]
MASPFHQLRLLLWKNALSVIRQPGWSLALLIWPLVIFIILAVTRSAFPPVVKDTCYVAPRNLPSAGFFPFLQTLMCNADGSCSNRSYLLDSTGRHRVARDTSEDNHDRLALLSSIHSIMSHLQKENLIRNIRSVQSNDSQPDPMDLWGMMLNSTSESVVSNNTFLTSVLNSTIVLDEEVLKSFDQVKQTFCTVYLSFGSLSAQTYHDPLETLCQSNATFLEASLLTLTEMLLQQLEGNPMDAMHSAGLVMAVFQQLQEQTSLWDFLLEFPNLFLLPMSNEDVLNAAAERLQEVQSALNFIQTGPFSMVNPAVDGVTSLLKFTSALMKEGLFESISQALIPVNTTSTAAGLHNLIQNVTVLLNKAGLMVETGSIISYMCSNSGISDWWPACANGQLDKLFDWITPEKVVEQVLIAWNNNSRDADVIFAKLMDILWNGITPASANLSMSPNNSFGQPQNPGEDLFLSIGTVVMDLLLGIPGSDFFIQSLLMGGHASMQLAAQAMVTQIDLMALVLKNAQDIESISLDYLQNQSMSDSWVSEVVDSIVNTLIQVLSVQDPEQCKNLSAEWPWIPSLNSSDLWISLVCSGNSSNLEDTLRTALLPLTQKVNQLVDVLEGKDKYNVTLDMLVLEWHKLSNVSGQYIEFLQSFFNKLDQAYHVLLTDWNPSNTTANWPNILAYKVLETAGVLGSQLENSPSWNVTEPYFRIAYYIMTYDLNITTTSDCSINGTVIVNCSNDFNMEKFISTIKNVIQDLSANPEALLGYIQVSLDLLQGYYNDIYTGAVSKFHDAQPNKSVGSIGGLFEGLIQELENDMQLLSVMTSTEELKDQLAMSFLGKILKTLLDDLWAGGDVNTSTIIPAILEAAQNNEYFLSGLSMNQTNSSLADLEGLVMKWLSTELSVTLPVFFGLSDAILKYSVSLNSTDFNYLQEVLQPIANQSSVAQLILKSMDFLKQTVDSHSNESEVILPYIYQLENFLQCAFKTHHYVYEGGLSSTSNITLQPVVMHLIEFLDPSSILNLTQAGDFELLAAMLHQLGAVLPLEFHLLYDGLVNRTNFLIGDVSSCLASEENCSATFSHIASILNEASKAMNISSGNVTLNLGPELSNTSINETADLFKMLLYWTNISSTDESTMNTVTKLLQFIQEITGTPNITIDSLKLALTASNLSAHELDKIAILAMNTSMPEILEMPRNIVGFQQCLSLNLINSSMLENLTEQQCVLNFIHITISCLQTLHFTQDTLNFLTDLEPSIYTILEKSLGGKNIFIEPPKPSALSKEGLNMILDSIREKFKYLNLTEAMLIENELNVLEGLISFAFHERYPYSTINDSLLQQKVYAQNVYLEIFEWYLKKLENVANGSHFGDLLIPMFRLTEMEVALNLAQTNFSALVSNQIEDIMTHVELPLDETDVSEIRLSLVTTVEGLRNLLQETLDILQDGPVNISAAHEIPDQIMSYLNLTEDWLTSPNITSAISSIFQLGIGNITGSGNTTIPNIDSSLLITILDPFLSEEDKFYLTIFSEASQALTHALQVASQGSGLQSANFTDSILEAVTVILNNVTAESEPVRSFVLGALNGSLQLILSPEMNYGEARGLTLDILNSVDELISSLLPEELLLPMINILRSYTETIAETGGTENWNNIIIGVIKGLEENLPQNNSAQPVLSMILQVTDILLNTSQESSASLWKGLGNLNVSSLEELSKQIITSRADQHTFERLEEIIVPLLPALSEIPGGNSVPSVLHVIKEVIASITNNVQAQTDFIYNVQNLAVNLTSHVLSAVNTRNFNVNGFLRELESSLQHTIEAALQAQDVNCTSVLRMWAGVIEEGGISTESFSACCDVNWIPLAESFKAIGDISILNLMATGLEEQSVNVTASEMVTALVTLYEASLNYSVVIEDLTAALTQVILEGVKEIGMGYLPGPHVELDSVQIYLQQSFSVVEASLNEVLTEAPWAYPYVSAVEKATQHIIQNSFENDTSPQQLLAAALDILLTGLNYTNESVLSLIDAGMALERNGRSIDKAIKDAIEVVLQRNLLGNWPVVQDFLQVFVLNTNDTNSILDSATEFYAWISSTEQSGIGLYTEALPRLFAIFHEFLSTVTQLPSGSEVYIELTGNILNMLRQIAHTSDLFSSIDSYLALLQGEMSWALSLGDHIPLTQISSRRADQGAQSGKLGDILDVDYGALFQVLSVPPTPTEIMETIHVFFSNPDLAVVMKGMSEAMPGSPEEESIDRTLNMLSYLTAPSQTMDFEKMFMMMMQMRWNVQDYGMIENLVDSFGKMVDVASQLSLNISPNVQHIAVQVTDIVFNIINHKTNTTNVASELLTAVNSILTQNLEASNNVSTEITSILLDIINSTVLSGPQIDLPVFETVLNEIIGVFSSNLPTETFTYFNTSGQMAMAFANLVSYPWDTEKVIQASIRISESLNNLLEISDMSALPVGQSIENAVQPVIMDSALAAYALWNLSSVHYMFRTSMDKEMLVNQSIAHLNTLFPEDVQVYTQSLSTVLLRALSSVSSTNDIRFTIMNISQDLTTSLLHVFNITQAPETMDPHDPTHLLYVISNQVLESLFDSLMMNSSSMDWTYIIQSLDSVLVNLNTVMPSEAVQYLNISFRVLKDFATTLNFTTNTGDSQGAASAIFNFVETVLSTVPLQYPYSNSVFDDLELTVKTILHILSAGQGHLEPSADIIQQVLLNIQKLLPLTNNSMEFSATEFLLSAAQNNGNYLLEINSTNWEDKIRMALTNITESVPDDLPFAPLIKNVALSLTNESQENLNLLLQTLNTASELLFTSWMSDNFSLTLDRMSSQVCALEGIRPIVLVTEALSMEPGVLCQSAMPTVQALHVLSNFVDNTTHLFDALFDIFIGDPVTYNIETDWTRVISRILGFNVTSLTTSFEINITTNGEIKVSELLSNPEAFAWAVQNYTDLTPEIVDALLNSSLPSSNLQILSSLTSLRYCNDPYKLHLSRMSTMIFNQFCSLSPVQWYKLVVLVARHINVENMFFKLLLSSDMQNLLGTLLQLVQFLTDMMNKLLPAINRLQEYLVSFSDLNLMANAEFRGLVRGKRSTMSSKATFLTLSRALCSHGILSLFAISRLPSMLDFDSSVQEDYEKEQLIEKFMIPHDASPFCMNLFLDMVNTTGGAVAWAFLKPMLLGQVLYTPDTPLTRAIIEKSNGTLHQFGELKLFAEEWLQSSAYIMQSAQLLNQTLPMLQNSLSNMFVQNFIEAQTNIDVAQMRETLKSFSNVTELLERNKFIVQQITTLSSLMMNLSSCVNFDRYKAFGSAEELDEQAEILAQTRDLYASIIFKLPANVSVLPKKVDYTIRMDIENSMRTDRVRNPIWVRDSYISFTKTQRYNRGFVYLQESIDRAIIEIQTGAPVSEPAVQLQAFPYPCFPKDKYLESISFAFPLVLMIAWVLFIAHFVKMLVHERELRLHEYMKMMGVNPTSHFFAWFIESSCFLLVTIIILTFILSAGGVLPRSNPFLLFLYLSNYGFSILAISFLISSFFDKTNIAGLSGGMIYIITFFPFIVVMSMESNLSLSVKSALSLFSPTCFSCASQYISRYEAQEQGIQWDNIYISPMSGDSGSFGWLCWLLLIDSFIYFFIGAYIRMVFPGKYGIAAPWYFPVMASFWCDLFGCSKKPEKAARGLFFSNVMNTNFPHNKGKGHDMLHTQAEDEFPGLPVGVSLNGLTKIYGNTRAIDNLNLSFYEGHVTTLLGHNGAGKTTTMSLLTGLFAPSSGTIEVYGRDMQMHTDAVRKDLGVCMQYDVHFDHMTTEEHLLLYGQIKAPHWTRQELHMQVRKILEETGMYAHRHKRVGTLSGGMKRKLSISIAFIGGSRLVVLDEPTTGVDPCSRRSIWDIVLQHKTDRTIILSTHHLDEAEVLSDRIAFMERGGLKCCGSPFYLKDKLAKGYNLTLTKKVKNPDSDERFDNAEVKTFIQSHLPDAQLKDDGEVGDVVFSLPPYSSQNASAYRSLLSSLDQNLDVLQLGCYGISDTTLEEVFLSLTKDDVEAEERPWSVSETVLETAASTDSLPDDLQGSSYSFGEKTSLTGSSTVHGWALVVQQIMAMLTKRVHHSRRDWKGLASQILLPVLFVVAAMGLGSIRSDLQHFPEMQLSPGLYSSGNQYAFFSNQNPDNSSLVDTMMSFPGIDTLCMDNPYGPTCSRSSKEGPLAWTSSGNSSQPYEMCKCTKSEQICQQNSYDPPHMRNPSSQIVYNLTGLNVEDYLITTANDFIRDRYGGWSFGMPLPPDLQMDLLDVPKNRTLSKVWYNTEGHHTMPAYLNSLNNFILRSSLPAGGDSWQYAISVSSHPYPGQVEEEDIMVRGLVNTLVALCILTGFSIMTASFAVYEVQEYHSGSKRLQHISGISEPFYWAINFLYDLALYMVPVVLCVIVIAAFQLPAFTDRLNLGAVTLLLVLFGFATFPWMYLLTSVFKDTEMAFISYVCINLFISINTIVSTAILFFLGELNKDDENIQQVYRTLSHVFLIFPQFSFGNGLLELARGDVQVQILAVFGVDAYKNPYSTDVLGWMFLSLFLQGLGAFTLRLLLNKWLIRKIRTLIFPRKTLPQEEIFGDEDVVAEHQRVDSGAANSDILQINQLSKVYKQLNKNVVAVKKLSIGIPAGECFGLLGVNGAGKTTTFKMLTGDTSPTEGTAQIRDWDGRMVDIINCRNEGINIGYCPQVDALDDMLTGEEHLYFYARIRGISKREIDRVVNYLLKRLELGYHRHNTAENYSCGTRRKLSTALALIGHPQILLLDEPSSGMDPRTKRHLWKIISEEVEGKCAVVLTSHSMEECEALCSRLAIMVKGQFRCLGSLQHIKNRFGSGFTVKMYLFSAACDVNVITSFMQEHFPSTYLKDHHSSMVEYHVPVAPGGVADIFDQLESNKSALQIKHFSVSQTTLDEVFINFAMGKVGMETDNSESADSDSLDSFDT